VPLPDDLDHSTCDPAVCHRARDAQSIIERHPAVAARLRWFEYKQLPPYPRPTSQMCHDLAHEMARRFPAGGDVDQLLTGLQRLIEAKDAFVRAMLPATTEGPS